MNNPFSTVTLALMSIAIVINVVVGQLIYALQIPIYLDSIGTILAGVLGGPIVGAVVGLLSNVVAGLITGSTITWFTIISVAIGILAGVFGARGWMRNLGLTLVAAVITGVIAATFSALIQAYLLGGITGGGTDFITAFYLNMTENVVTASLLQGYTVDPLDKIISYLVVFFVLRGMSRRLLVRFPQGDKSAEPRREPLIGRVQK